ncbi:G-patch domain and KOW motifs-containing protein [Scaptodrosophila lebanonensis]|uniref:G-patch domain and KOW motifs-containing protein n=1 Tax=Drosophila lebanonensis TaxID=7225 RepID=A0A6J2TDQ8_DROLE|nr:G-patch domain and KOW motifs-containing protein [Scaptodrosophila lebanonensis]
MLFSCTTNTIPNDAPVDSPTINIAQQQLLLLCFVYKRFRWLLHYCNDAMDAKKISFGFSKITKKPLILATKAVHEANKVELIKCLEGKEIKLVAEKQDATPLVIAMPTNQKTSSAIASLMKRRAVLLGEEDEEPEETTAEPQSIAQVTASANGSLEERAARELLAAALTNDNENLDNGNLVLPALKADELPLDGAKESSIDDYESIPIQHFGLAMLRGMGWVDPPPKKKGTLPADDAPFLRPKGMGLGADKALKSAKTLLVQPETNEVLEIKKKAFVRILGGKQKDQYGQIEGFDDHAGRVIVKMAIGGAQETFNEFLCQPVSKKEFAQYGKCINTAKYEKYKKHENEHGQIIVKQEPISTNKTERIDRKAYKTEERSDYKRDAPKFSSSTSNSRYSDRDQESRCSSTSQQSSSQARYREDRGRRSCERRRSRSPAKPSSSSNASRRQQSSSDEAEDTGESTESDSDSAYERKHKKKSSSSRSKKKKSKKPKSKLHRHRRNSDDSSSEHSVSYEDERSKHRNKHKKKTKKSKHARSRTRSRSRERGRGR